MKHERMIGSAAIALLAVAALIQTFRLDALRAEVAQWRDKASWPERPVDASAQPLTPSAFKPIVQKTIPEDFWGEFAEDVTECGGESSLLVAAAKLTERERVTVIARVDWRERGKLKVLSASVYGESDTFEMQMLSDRSEITFTFPNRKRIVQRCSMRQQPEPEPLKAAQAPDDLMTVDADGDYVNLDASKMVEPQDY